MDKALVKRHFKRMGKILAVIFPIISIILIPPLLSFGIPFPVNVPVDKSSENISFLLEDDDLADKNPQAVLGQSIPTSVHDLLLDKSMAVLGITTGQMDSKEQQELSRTIFPDYATAWEALKDQDINVIPSIEMVNTKLKQFNDGIIAAIEVALQEGLAEVWKGKFSFLKEIEARLEQDSYKEARIFVAAGLSLGNDSYTIPGDIITEVEVRKSDFLSLTAQSKPIGFYTWSSKLERIFQQDRYFQFGFFVESSAATGPNTFGEKVIFQLGKVLNDSLLRETYLTILDFQCNVTNPPYLLPIEVLIDYIPDNIASLRGAVDAFAFDASNSFPRLIEPDLSIAYPQAVVVNPYRVFSLFPPAYAKETEIIQKLTAIGAIGNFMDEFIKALWKGDIDFTPDSNSGWYDYQLWSLETLLNPSAAEESDRLFLTKEYKERLVSAFKTIMTKNRETHIKFLGGLSLLSLGPLEMEIEIHLEPQVTVLLRQISGYVFLYECLVNLLSEDFLLNIYRFYESGINNISVKDEFTSLLDLLGGLALISGDDLGHPVNLTSYGLTGRNDVLLKEKALDWLDNIQSDPDMQTNVQMSVPIGPGDTMQAMYYWGILGIRPIKLKFWYEIEPRQVELRYLEIIWLETEYWILVDEFCEFQSTVGPWNRQEFQELLKDVSTREEAEKRLNIKKDQPYFATDVIFLLLLLIITGTGTFTAVIVVKKRKL